MTALDEPTPLALRELTFGPALAAFLADRLGLPEPIEILRFPGGKANLTYLVRSGTAEVVVRRPPFGDLPRGAHDMVREHRAVAALAPHLPFVPRPLLLCDDPDVIGAPFFVMERLHGVVLRERWPDGGGGPQVRARLSAAFLDVVVDLHAVDAVAVGLSDLGRPDGFMARQIAGWGQRGGETVDPADAARAGRVFAWLASRPASAQPPTVVHNDLKLDNVLLEAGDLSSIVALLDWDMCTRGDPLADLGTLLAYWAEPDDDPAMYGGYLPPTHLPGFARRLDLCEAYAQRTGRDLGDLRTYAVFGLAKVAVLCQQLLRRYEVGQSDDERLAAFRDQVPALWRRAEAVLRAPSLDL